ncbi:putative CocE/NonD family hydrolase [Allocatelliglobosispora scoriae]|uniref:Putative CocE/NonD family hydrolase n=1 Tax=Allocatelliglobosispora scoriae TaxID=643052 RepID=A0A841BM41_9ACTN|nr:CocE/NonD family hydrolase [Allocatelliglobosispora scoriae]MBB5867931.1 putative CocE/NonD family hydrolase [Allocatelliglobosispora scoriae]
MAHPATRTRPHGQPLPRHVKLLSKLGGKPDPAALEVAYEPGLTVPAADGSPMVTDHYFPVVEGDYPTLLVRSPYGRGFPWTALYGNAYAQQGFHVVLQSCRGTGGSGGTFDWFRNEDADGHAAVAWLREQPWFNGVLGTVGISYLGYVQFALALDPPPELRAMVIQAGGHDPYGNCYAGGSFALETVLIAGVAMVHQGKGTLKFIQAGLRLQRHMRRIISSLPIIDAYVPGIGERVSIIEDSLRHAERDHPYWAGKDMSPVAESLAIPTSMVAGWFDLNLDQNLAQHERLVRAGCPNRLLIGPWTHSNMLEDRSVLIDSAGWLRAYLTADRSGLPPTPVRVHVGGVMPEGVDAWRDLAEWPPVGVSDRPWSLAAGGKLTTAEAAATGDALATVHYDPASPTPSLGGPVLSRGAGPRDNSSLEARPDVLTFTGEPLTDAVEVLGAVSAVLRVSIGAAASADVFARLCDVDEKGRSVNVCDGLLRISAGGRITVPMSSTAHRFAPGHRIRLQVSGGAHPRYARNLGTGEPLATATRLVPVDITVESGSQLLLPVAA